MRLADDEGGVEKLFFELSSESRLDILHELEKGNLRMQEVARRLDLTSTEAFRQLGRLSGSRLLEKRPDGSYAITRYARLVLDLAPGFEFAHANQEYLLEHDIWRMPPQFVRRIGELSKAQLVLNANDGIDRAERLFLEAREFGWGMAEGRVPEAMRGLMEQKYREGMRLRFIIPEATLPNHAPPVQVPGIDTRAMPDIPAVVIRTDRGAGLFFRFEDGRMDYAGLFGDDRESMEFASDLFLHCWEKAR
jgi:DNA-binding transcriptional ArsR family regulator